MDLDRLRKVLRPEVIKLYTLNTHTKLPELCETLGLPAPDPGISKREKLTEAFDGLPDENLAHTAKCFLESQRIEAGTRNEIQDIIWADLPVAEIPKRFRREVARAIQNVALYLDGRRFDELLDRLWVLDNDPMAAFSAVFGKGDDRSLRAQINQHVYKNPEDWSAEDLFDAVGAFDASNRRFALFLEGLASADVRPDETEQRRFVNLVNPALRGCGAELREAEIEDGYPVFSLVSIHCAPPGRAKNLIFASSVKPDIRFRDAVSNNIEIASNTDKVLVYDRPIGTGGLCWRDLQAWWSESQGIPDDDQAKRGLYLRLLKSLPRNSPPQAILFRTFFSHFKGSFPGLPALLPEVWLHWDPKTVRERGPQALLRFRMDFLLLLPQGVRVVLEVDGKHHYAREDGTADPARYSKMVAADRELALAGYYVFRFGAEELSGEAGTKAVADFFDLLFKRFKVSIPRA
jgi:hypothetical protein